MRPVGDGAKRPLSTAFCLLSEQFLIVFCLLSEQFSTVFCLLSEQFSVVPAFFF